MPKAGHKINTSIERVRTWRRRAPAVVASAILLGGLAVTGTSIAHAQPVGTGGKVASPAMWQPYGAAPAARNATTHASLQIDAPHGRLFTLDHSSMLSALAQAPAEFTAQAASAPMIVSLPDPIKGFQRFKLEYAPVMSAALAAQHPEIRTYSGVGIDDKYATVRIAMTPLGFSASVRGVHGSWYVDTLYHNDTSAYISYYASDLVNKHGDFIEREDAALDTEPLASPSATSNYSAGSTLRVYRLALVSDPSFAAYWGAANVTAGKVILMTRVDQIYEEEFAYRMELVGNNDVLNLNTPAQAYEPNGPCGANPCFTRQSLAFCSGLTLNRNRMVVGQLIGADNYDIGHIAVGEDGGGIAGLGVVGRNNKAMGCTGIPEPDGDYYVVDYLTHEMGHEFGMNHPFNGTQYNCSTGNRNPATSYEPGSGSSIMAYAGICRQDDLQPHSDPYFTAISFRETQTYTGKSVVPQPEVQTGVLTHLGGGNEVETATLAPGFQTVSTVDHGPLRLNPQNPSSSTFTYPGAAEVGHVVSMNTTTAHHLNVGDVVTVKGVPVDGYNGTWTVTAVPRTTEFQFIDPVAGLAQTGTGAVIPSSFGAVESGNTVTVTTLTPHNLVVGTKITVGGMTVDGYNGWYSVSAVLSPTMFQYVDPTAGLTRSGGGTITSYAGFQLKYNGTDTATIGGTGARYSNAAIAAALNAVIGTPGSVQVSGANGFGFTVTFSGGAVAGTNVPNLKFDHLSCGCYGAIDETNHGGAGDTYALKYGSKTSSTLGVDSSAADITAALQQVLPAGATASVAVSGFGGTLADGFSVTFGGTLDASHPAAATIALLRFVNLTGTARGYFAETEKGGPVTGNHGTTSSTGNTPPTAVAPTRTYTIPYRTPFALTGSSTDADGETPTYMWEQFDRGRQTVTGGTALVDQTKTNGPLFREFGTALDAAAYNVHGYGSCGLGGNPNGENCVGTDPTRVFPDMAQILADNTNAATGTCPTPVPSAPTPLPQALVDCLSEFLPTSAYAGPMHFVLTTRDGHPGAGGVTESSLVTVKLAGGEPFRVTSQATPVSYAAGSSQTVTWDVAGTNVAPINTASVDILLSTDGGNTFSTVLAANVPNNGSALVTIPNVSTFAGRIEVRPADGNIYFDVSHSDFTIHP